VTAVHIVLGVAVIVLNAGAALWGWLLWRRGDGGPRAWWRLLRAGQAVLMVEAVDGAILVASGHALPPLHLIYGLVPLAVSFVAEQLRLAAAGTVLDQHGLEGRPDLELLTGAEQTELVQVIMRRELGVMAASAGVVALLGVRAAGLL
jgi:hypothetical protein